jgi:hypothetical protein
LLEQGTLLGRNGLGRQRCTARSNRAGPAAVEIDAEFLSDAPPTSQIGSILRAGLGRPQGNVASLDIVFSARIALNCEPAARLRQQTLFLLAFAASALGALLLFPQILGLALLLLLQSAQTLRLALPRGSHVFQSGLLGCGIRGTLNAISCTGRERWIEKSQKAEVHAILAIDNRSAGSVKAGGSGAGQRDFALILGDGSGHAEWMGAAEAGEYKGRAQVCVSGPGAFEAHGARHDAFLPHTDARLLVAEHLISPDDFHGHHGTVAVPQADGLAFRGGGPDRCEHACGKYRTTYPAHGCSPQHRAENAALRLDTPICKNAFCEALIGALHASQSCQERRRIPVRRRQRPPTSRRSFQTLDAARPKEAMICYWRR